MTTVAYVYAESWEVEILGDVLDGFSGVLVSDFYGAYDSVPRAQQKCLIHLTIPLQNLNGVWFRLSLFFLVHYV